MADRALGEVFRDAVRDHDGRVREAGLDVWLGGEPTFTDARSLEPAWLHEALGADKEARARRLLGRLFAAQRGAVVMRTVGRQYAGEPRPRWSYGLLSARDADHPPLFGGPPDPAVGGRPVAGEDAGARAEALRDRLARRLEARGFLVAAFDLEAPQEALPWRVAWRADAPPPPRGPDEEPDLARPPLATRELPKKGLEDALSDSGTLLVAVGVTPIDGDVPGRGPEERERAGSCVVVELPRAPSSAALLDLLAHVGAAARAEGLEGLILTGYPPPADPSLAFTTVTPDPAVVEVNMAPCASLEAYLEATRRVFDAAAAVGLAPERHLYNGDVRESGGGGHLTFGGPSPEASPFFGHPALLPALVVYLNHHPSLSYLFAVDALGSSGQAPRTDEGAPEALAELQLALDILGEGGPPGPAALWAALAPFLVDRSGNPHRAELNIEKLWSDRLGARGRLGVCELRALRMAETPERQAAVAALFRAVLARLARGGGPRALVRWGEDLHDRYALPFYLEEDLRAVLADLEAAGAGLGAPLVRALEQGRSRRLLGRAEGDDLAIEVRRAVEFWPLVGDVASQERGTSRVVDASTTRLEMRVTSARGDLERLRLRVEGLDVPLRVERAPDGPCALFGVRYRTFVPSPGLHPQVGPREVVRLLAWREGEEAALSAALHEWIPGGGVYDGLPADAEEAARRRAERFPSSTVPAPTDAPRPAPERALTAYHLDLRRVQA